jgi:hypothetical protein
MVVPADDGSGAEPYPGLRSFRREDAKQFFGRETANEQILSRVLAQTLTVLHARSGAGKTSLVNARVIPALNRAGWFAIRSTPGLDPSGSLREAVLNQVLPSPLTEQVVLERAWQALGQPAGAAELVAQFLNADARGIVSRDLLADVEGPGLLPGSTARATPWVARVLEGSVAFEDYLDHLEVLAGTAHGTPHRLNERVDVVELFDILSDLVRPADRLRHTVAGSGPGLLQFFETLFATYGHHRISFKLVVVLDQFEELFTQFVEQRSSEASVGPPWEAKWRFIAELRDLVTQPDDKGRLAWDALAGTARGGLPLHLLIALRSDYLADLDPIREFYLGLDAATMHLPLLRPSEARQAIEGPAKLFEITFEPDCVEQIVRDLTRERRFVDPPALQVVCSTLCPTDVRSDRTEPVPPITSERLAVLGGVIGILEAYLANSLKAGYEDPLEAVEMLSGLVTTSRTRNIVEEKTMVTRPFRDRARRETMLNRLQKDGLVRRERRLGTSFIEITHEFLVGSILREARKCERDLWSLDVATTGLNRLARGEARELSQVAWTCVDDNAQRLVLPLWATEAMLRGCLQHNVSDDAVRKWAERYEQSEADRERSDELLAAAVHARRFLSLAEWRHIATDLVGDGMRSLPHWEWLALSGLTVAQRSDQDVYAEVVRGWLKSWHTRAR